MIAPVPVHCFSITFTIFDLGNRRLVLSEREDKGADQFRYIYLRPKVTLHFSVPNISTFILDLSKLNIAMSFQHMPELSE